MSAPEVLVVGVGGIGGTILGRLTLAGVRAVGVTPNGSVRAAPLRLGGILGDATFEAPVVDRAEGTFPFILLATRPSDVEAAARDALPSLAPGGALVCLQNGLCEARIARLAGDDVLGAVVAFGASMPAPGHFVQTSRGGFVLGRLDGAADPRLEALAGLLAPVGPSRITDNLAGARWSKLAINCAITSIGALGRDTLGALMRHAVVRRLALEVITEVAAVADAEGVRVEKVAGTFALSSVSLQPAHRRRWHPGLWRRHLLLAAVGLRYRRLRSSMLYALERGRPPAVEFLNGEVTARGAALGVPTPVNEAVVELVHALARGDEPGGLPTIRRLAARAGLC